MLAGDSAGGYLALALAERLQLDGEEPAADGDDVAAVRDRQRAAHQAPEHSDRCDVPAQGIRRVGRAGRAAAERNVDGKPEEVYEPLDHIEPGLPRTLIHVSGSEVLLNDARKAAHMLAAAGVPVEVRVWPGQMHVFQLAAPTVTEATRSLRQIGDYIREATW